MKTEKQLAGNQRYGFADEQSADSERRRRGQQCQFRLPRSVRFGADDARSSYGANGIMVINGTPNNNIQVRVDGQVSGNLGGLRQYTAQQQPSTDAIQEVAVQTSNYSAEFGTVGGGIFNASMKSAPTSIPAADMTIPPTKL